MNNTIKFLATGVILLVIFSWSKAGAQGPYFFTANPNNPVITHGAPGSYDSDLLIAPFPIWDEGTFYLFYTGNFLTSGICLATSHDGYNYTKFNGNPVLTASGTGFDSLFVSGGVVLKVGQQWVMYYNARHNDGYGPSENVGRATADSLTGAWVRFESAVLTVGSPGEWDDGFICPTSVLPQDTGGLMMFYYASHDLSSLWLMGMATSSDGITWTKYNDPSTTTHPFEESDPILPPGGSGSFDEYGVAGASVLKRDGYYDMYYSGFGGVSVDIGYASSPDGITWQKWPENPVYTVENDPYGVSINSVVFEQPAIFVYNSTVFMYYDYGTVENSIGLATADVPIGIRSSEKSKGELMISNYPNPVYQSTVFSYSLEEPRQVKLEIYDSFGRLVAELVNSLQQKGEHKVIWNAEAYPAGIYYYRLQLAEKTGGGKLIVNK